MTAIKLKSKVAFAYPPSQTNAHTKSNLGNKPNRHKRKRKNNVKLQSRYMSGGSAQVRPPPRPSTIDQSSSVKSGNSYAITKSFTPPYQDAKNQNKNLPPKLPSSYQYDSVSHPPLDESSIIIVDGNGEVYSKRESVDNTDFVPAVDPVQFQEVIELQKIKSNPKPRERTEKEQREEKSRAELMKQYNAGLKGVPSKPNNETQNFSALKRISRRNSKYVVMKRGVKTDFAGGKQVISNETGLPIAPTILQRYGALFNSMFHHVTGTKPSSLTRNMMYPGVF